MKLVDILARELKVWPEPTVPLNGGKDDCCQSDETTEVYFGYGRESLLLSKRAENTIGVSVTRAEWKAAVDALKVAEGIADAEAGNLIPLDDVKDKWASRSWNGEGLPPVGLDVEIKRGNCTWIDGDEWQIGKTATVMASFLNSRDIEMASVQFPGGHCECILARCLSPIRTAEQVAAEERDKARTEVLNAMTENGKTANEPEALWQFRLKVVGEMLDMGYRKQVAP